MHEIAQNSGESRHHFSISVLLGFPLAGSNARSKFLNFPRTICTTRDCLEIRSLDHSPHAQLGSKQFGLCLAAVSNGRTPSLSQERSLEKTYGTERSIVFCPVTHSRVQPWLRDGVLRDEMEYAMYCGSFPPFF